MKQWIAEQARQGLLVLISATAFAACGGRDTGPDAESTQLVLGPEDVAVARITTVGSGIVLTGSLEPATKVTIKAQVPGTVTGVRVDRGTPVRRGQILAVIEAGGIRGQAAGARAGVAGAQANLALARQRLEAARTLHQAGAMSEIEYRTAVAAYEAAQAQVAAARAQSATAGEAAARTIITSPITGVVSDRRVEGGEAVNPGADLFTVVNSEVLELAGQVGVQQATRVRVGQPVVFSLESNPGQEFRGRVARMDPTADPATRQVGVYVQLPNPGGRILGGQFATGRVQTGAAPAHVVVPTGALRRVTGDSATVLVISNGRIVRRTVRIGSRDEAAGVVSILSGVQAGERVVTAQSDIPDGTAVTTPTPAARASVPAQSGER